MVVAGRWDQDASHAVFLEAERGRKSCSGSSWSFYIVLLFFFFRCLPNSGNSAAALGGLLKVLNKKCCGFDSRPRPRGFN